MVIQKYGTVTITKDRILTDGFTVDLQQGTVSEGFQAILDWASEQIEAARTIQVNDLGGNVVNGRALSPEDLKC